MERKLVQVMSRDLRVKQVAPKGLMGRMKEFNREEDGAIVIFGMFCFLMMLLVAGVAIDVMRYEARRSVLQSTLDRAVLAAADLDQKLHPEDVVRDYFDKAGLDGSSVQVDLKSNTAKFRRVEARVTSVMPTMFMRMVGVPTLGTPAAGAAIEGLDDVEISLVLDISGSMRNNNKIPRLRSAAKKFITQVLKDENKISTTINVVPYAGQVNVGEDMFQLLGGSRVHNNSSCIEVEAADFNSTGAIASGRAQVPHFMKWRIDNPTMDWGWCPQEKTSIQYAQNEEADLHKYIDAMRLHDGTGTMYGMRYGLMLLDPSLQPKFMELSGKGKVPAKFANRPGALHKADAPKYIVLMTDGQITDQFRPKNTGIVDNDGNDKDDEKYANGTKDIDKEDGIDFDLYNAQYELDRQPGEYKHKRTTRSHNLVNFYKACDLAKENGITVFTIAFEAPSSAQTEMKNCATSPSHFYKVDGVDIEKAFAAIANTINHLRLIN